MNYKKVEEYIENYLKIIDEITNDSNLLKRFNDIRELGLNIESILKHVYQNDPIKLKEYMDNYRTKLSVFVEMKDIGVLQEILGFLKRILNSTKVYIELKKSSEEPNRKKQEVFLCHSSDDIKLTLDIKDLLEAEGIDVFVAHKDIKKGKGWREEMLNHLETCNFLIALDTENFRKSPYANQEVGIAWEKDKTKDKTIVPLFFTDEKSGLLETKQGIEVKKEDTTEIIVKKIIKAIKKE